MARINVLLLGSGGREHALAASLAASPLLGRLIVAPGNPGTAGLGDNLPCDLADPSSVVRLARCEAVDLVVVGPEAPLVAGVADALATAGIAVFGPSQAAARLEGSKAFTKALCREVGVPTAAYAQFTDIDSLRRHLRDSALPIVIKADGLAAGKGVVVAATRQEAEEAVGFMVDGLGAAASTVVVEEYLEGREISFFVVSDGERAIPLGTAEDHKRVGDGDTGANTGGMGAISPAPAMTPALEAEIMASIIEPTLRGLRQRGTPFRGLLFAGLMLTAAGPQLIEFNVRFGDPETEAMLPRLEEDLLALLDAAARGRLPDRPIRLRPETGVAVVLAARGYPGVPVKGSEIRGLDTAGQLPGVQIFHAGTRREGSRLLADGGRVLVIGARGADPAEARARAYAAVGAIDWPEGFCRSDIGARPGTSGTSSLSDTGSIAPSMATIRV